MRLDDCVLVRTSLRFAPVPLLLLACGTSGERPGFQPTDASADGPVTGSFGGGRDGGGTGGSPREAGPPPYTPPPSDASSSPGVEAGGSCAPPIDDMEHGDGSILPSCGRRGYWYTYNDGTVGATQTPAAGGPFVPEAIPGGRGASAHAAHSTGTGFTAWGAGVAFDLNSPGGAGSKLAYDASAYGAMTFWAKVGTGGGASLRVNIASRDTEPLGGVCSPASKCNDHFGATLTLTSSWQEFTLRFRELRQQGWGTPAVALDSSQLFAVQFQLSPGQSFDIWIDDVSFAL